MGQKTESYEDFKRLLFDATKEDKHTALVFDVDKDQYFSYLSPSDTPNFKLKF